VRGTSRALAPGLAASADASPRAAAGGPAYCARYAAGEAAQAV
jgi:hypothetical protein